MELLSELNLWRKLRMNIFLLWYSLLNKIFNKWMITLIPSLVYISRFPSPYSIWSIAYVHSVDQRAMRTFARQLTVRHPFARHLTPARRPLHGAFHSHGCTDRRECCIASQNVSVRKNVIRTVREECANEFFSVCECSEYSCSVRWSMCYRNILLQYATRQYVPGSTRHTQYVTLLNTTNMIANLPNYTSSADLIHWSTIIFVLLIDHVNTTLANSAGHLRSN